MQWLSLHHVNSFIHWSNIYWAPIKGQDHARSCEETWTRGRNWDRKTVHMEINKIISDSGKCYTQIVLWSGDMVIWFIFLINMNILHVYLRKQSKSFQNDHFQKESLQLTFNTRVQWSFDILWVKGSIKETENHWNMRWNWFKTSVPPPLW